MTAERWETVQTLFHQALDRPPTERAAFLAMATDDPTVADDVRALLDADASGHPLFEGGVARAAGVLDAPAPGPETVGPYRVVGVLGEGGMGVVYLAERDDLGSRAAVKVLRDAALSPARRERFRREEQILAGLDHPAIARLLDADVLADGTPYFVMEYVEGVPITDHVRARGLSVAERLALFRDVCGAVAAAHRQAVVHRDLKPSNVLVTGDGRVKLLDFGIAKSIERIGDADLTVTGLRLMTPAYAAPEQLRGEPVGVYTDVYALGALLYEVLTGERPHDLAGLTPGQAEARLLNDAPAPPSTRAGGAARGGAARGGAAAGGAAAGGAGRRTWAELDVVCATALHKDPDRRYATVEALVRDLDHVRDGQPLDARPDSWAYRAGTFLRRHRRPVAVAAAVLVGVVGLVAVYTVRLAAARDVAVAEAARTERVQRFTQSLFRGGDAAAGPADTLRVVTLLGRGVREAAALAGEPDLQAELYQTLGTLAQGLGDLSRADSLLTASLALRRAHLGPGHPATAEALVALGDLRRDQAEYDDAERLTRAGLARLRAALPPDHPRVAEAVTGLGRVLTARGEYDAALGVLDEAVRLGGLQGPTSAARSDALYEAVEAHFYAGDYAAVDSLGGLVLALDRRLYGPRHPRVADDLANLSAAEFQRGRYREAEQLSRRALAINRAYYGPDHDACASTMMMVGQALAHQDRYDEALGLLRPALAVRERVYGPDHPRVANVLNELATVALRQGDLDGAEAHYRRAVDVYRAAYDDDHYLLAVGLSNLATVQFRAGNHGGAERTMREALARSTRALGADHVNTAQARIKLGTVLADVGRHAEAEALLLAGYRTLRGQTDPADPWLETAREELAAVYDALGRPAQAARYRATRSTGA